MLCVEITRVFFSVPISKIDEIVMFLRRVAAFCFVVLYILVCIRVPHHAFPVLQAGPFLPRAKKKHGSVSPQANFFFWLFLVLISSCTHILSLIDAYQVLRSIWLK